MNKILPKAALCIILLTCTACSTPYYGYSKQDWNNLSEEEKTKAKAEYEDIIKANRDQKQKDLILDQKHKIIDRALDEPYPLAY